MKYEITRTNLTCTKCGYLLDGINLRENCPECGTRIINNCYWCDYDLSNTTPNSVCPECGVPVTASIGSGILIEAPIETLKSIHTGFRMVTILLVIYIVVSIAGGIIASILAATIANSSMYFFVIANSIISNGLLLAIALGWWKLSQPLQNLPAGITGNDKRSLLRVTTWLFVASTLATLLYNFIPRNYNPTAPPTSLIFIAMIMSFVGLVIMLLFFIAQVRYIGWFAKLVHNRKMERRAKHFVWSGPLIAIIGAIFLFIGPLIVLVLYWNMIEYTRRDLKKVINTIERNA